MKMNFLHWPDFTARAQHPAMRREGSAPHEEEEIRQALISRFGLYPNRFTENVGNFVEKHAIPEANNRNSEPVLMFAQNFGIWSKDLNLSEFFPEVADSLVSGNCRPALYKCGHILVYIGCE